MRAFLVVLVLLVAAGVGLGFYLDWFGLTVNTDKMNEDTEGAKDNLRELGKKIKDKTNAAVAKAKEKNGTPAADVKTATGKVKTVEAADSHFLMTTADNTEMTVYTDASSKLRLNDEEFKLDRLQVGDEVKVGYDLKEGKNLATSVTVKRN
jgi:hypothetical protein